MKELHCKKCDNWTQHPEDAKCEWRGSLDTVTTATRGGAREGAGRKPGSGTGRTVTTSSINLTPELWQKLDTLRGDSTRSAWIGAKIQNENFDLTQQK